MVIKDFMSVKVFRFNMPDMSAHSEQEECGFSYYRGVIIQWDEDLDGRIFVLIDNLPRKIRKQLLIVQEHEGGLSLIWKKDVPDGYEDAEFMVCGDCWTTIESKSARCIYDY